MDDDDEVKAREESSRGIAEGEQQGVEERKKERKIYRGQVKSAGDLVGSKPLMIQPMQRKIPGTPTHYNLPPTFVATKFTPVLHDPARVQLHLFDPRSTVMTYREVGKDFELNVLTGRRGEELARDWEKAKKDNFSSMARRMSVTLGADPEIFVVNKKGEVVPAWDYLPSKASPKSIQSLVGGALGTAYWDGFQAEFTTPGYHTCLYEMTNSIQGGLYGIYNAAKKVDKGYALSINSVFQINPDVLMSASDEHVAFGCSPSYNAYGETPVAADGRTTSVRFAGGHLHLGMSAYAGKQKRLVEFVKGLDAVLGVASVSLFGAFDNPVRRKFYGRAGEYRMPRHGLEYRVLSNAWLMHPLMTHLVFDLARAVLGVWECGFGDIWRADEGQVREIINSHDVAGARKVLTQNKDAFLSILQLIGGGYGSMEDRETAYRIWLTGAESAIKDPTDLEHNWKLKGGWDADYAHVQQFFVMRKALAAGKRV